MVGINMENYNFNRRGYSYLCILGSDDATYDCYACESQDEVFKTLSERIFEEIEWLTQSGTDFSHWEDYGDEDEVEEIKAYINMLKSRGVIENPAILIRCYQEFFSSSWWFTVLDDYGEEWFGYHQ